MISKHMIRLAEHRIRVLGIRVESPRLVHRHKAPVPLQLVASLRRAESQLEIIIKHHLTDISLLALPVIQELIPRVVPVDPDRFDIFSPIKRLMVFMVIRLYRIGLRPGELPRLELLDPCVVAAVGRLPVPEEVFPCGGARGLGANGYMDYYFSRIAASFRIRFCLISSWTFGSCP